MVERRLDATFHALADPTRRGMLASLALGDKSVGELGQPLRDELRRCGQAREGSRKGGVDRAAEGRAQADVQPQSRAAAGRRRLAEAVEEILVRPSRLPPGAG